MMKGDKSLTARDLHTKLAAVSKDIGQWRLIALGRGYYEFQFAKSEDKRKA
ncbi:hypothetical protein A2U01_0029650, partial [Trifolium medium]|nr:hypothetical protein [Trifolium medium]